MRIHRASDRRSKKNLLLLKTWHKTNNNNVPYQSVKILEKKEHKTKMKREKKEREFDIDGLE